MRYDCSSGRRYFGVCVPRMAGMLFEGREHFQMCDPRMAGMLSCGLRYVSIADNFTDVGMWVECRKEREGMAWEAVLDILLLNAPFGGTFWAFNGLRSQLDM